VLALITPDRTRHVVLCSTPFRVSPGSPCSARGAPTLDEKQRVASRPTSSNPALDGYWEIELLAAAAASPGEGKTWLRAIRPSRTSITPPTSIE
jgi:hypothetical protein